MSVYNRGLGSGEAAECFPGLPDGSRTGSAAVVLDEFETRPTLTEKFRSKH